MMVAAAPGVGLVAVLVLAAACGFLVALALTGATLAYARRRGMLDQPGPRRSHTVPTPRGGGVGIVAAVLLVGIPAWLALDTTARWQPPAALAAAVLAVALVGWRDDRAALPAAPRLAVHLAAGLLVGAAVLQPAAAHDAWLWWAWPPLAVLLAGFINAHNFMDGIDGILGLQGLFALSAYALLAGWSGQPALAVAMAAAAAGCLGFLWFNLPPARVFMGDVGSGALGLAIGAGGACLALVDPATAWACLIVPSAFLVDSGLTLARRVVDGQRWSVPHRQHLYQWLARVNWGHARVDAAYLAWNVVVVAPLAWSAARWPARGAWFVVAAYAAAAAAWHVGKQGCLARARRRSIHERA